MSIFFSSAITYEVLLIWYGNNPIAFPGHKILSVYDHMVVKIRGTYEAFTASCGYRAVSKFARNTSRAFTLEYCAKTVVYGTILEQSAHFRPICRSLRRSVMNDLG